MSLYSIWCRRGAILGFTSSMRVKILQQNCGRFEHWNKWSSNSMMLRKNKIFHDQVLHAFTFVCMLVIFLCGIYWSIQTSFLFWFCMTIQRFPNQFVCKKICSIWIDLCGIYSLRVLFLLSFELFTWGLLLLSFYVCSCTHEFGSIGIEPCVANLFASIFSSSVLNKIFFRVIVVLMTF